MTDSNTDPIRAELTSLLPLCGNLAGLCIGIVAFINASGKGAATTVDDALAICAATFVLCIYLITWALRAQTDRRVALLTKAIEVFFLSALTAMTLAGFAMVYAVW